MAGPGLIEGDVKVRDGMQLGQDCHASGALFSEGDIHIGPGCRIAGVITSKGKLHLSDGVVLGSPQHPVSVYAEAIETEGSVQIHGRIHARIQKPIANSPSFSSEEGAT